MMYPRKTPVGPDAISIGKLQKILDEELKDWQKVKSSLPDNPAIERAEIFRTFVFSSFPEAMEFIKEIAPICEILTHHPRWENNWNTIQVYLSTWDDNMHNITFKDVLLARQFDKLYKSKYSGQLKLYNNPPEKPLYTTMEAVLNESHAENTSPKNKVLRNLATFYNQPLNDQIRASIEKLLHEYNAGQVDETELLKRVSSIYDPKISKQTNIFISYAHDDTEFKNEFLNYLSPLVRKGNVKIYHDDNVIKSGDRFTPAIINAIENSHIFLLLLSASFAKSDYIMNKEVGKMLAMKKDNDSLKIIPIFYKNVDFGAMSSIKSFQGYPRDQKYIYEAEDKDRPKLINGVSMEIRKAVDEVRNGK